MSWTCLGCRPAVQNPPTPGAVVLFAFSGGEPSARRRAGIARRDLVAVRRWRLVKERTVAIDPLVEARLASDRDGDRACVRLRFFSAFQRGEGRLPRTASSRPGTAPDTWPGPVPGVAVPPTWGRSLRSWATVGSRATGTPGAAPPGRPSHPLAKGCNGRPRLRSSSRDPGSGPSGLHAPGVRAAANRRLHPSQDR